MSAFLASWGTEILFAITSIILGIILKHFTNKISKANEEYRTLVEDKQDEKIQEMIKKALTPIYEKIEVLENNFNKKIDPIMIQIEDLKKEIKDTQTEELKHLATIKEEYRYKLIKLCKDYLTQGSMTNAQMEELTEIYKTYSSLGGNGQAKDYYDKAKALPIIER